MKIRWILALSLSAAAIPAGAMAADNVGGCGWGSKLFEGQSGIAPQVLAVTTNGTFGNQTFGITSGTSGCTQDGVVTSNWKMAMFIDGNQKRLAQDMSVGHGEALASLASLIGVRPDDAQAFYRVTQRNFVHIFPTASVTPEQVRTALRGAVAGDARLAQYAGSI